MADDLNSTMLQIHSLYGGGGGPAPPPINPLLANTMLGNAMAGSQSAAGQADQEKAARPSPEITLAKDDNGQPYVKTAKNLSLIDPKKASADAQTKPLDDVYSTLQKHGFTMERGSDAEHDTSTFGGAYHASRDLGNRPGHALRDAVLQHFGVGDTKGFVRKVANQRQAQADQTYERYVAPEERAAQVTNLHRRTTLQTILSQSIGQRGATPDAAIDSVRKEMQSYGYDLSPAEEDAVRAKYTDQKEKAAGDPSDDFFKRKKSLTTKDVEGYGPGEFDRWYQDQFGDLGKLDDRFVNQAKARFGGLQRANTEEKARFDKSMTPKPVAPTKLRASEALNMTEDAIAAAKGDESYDQPSVDRAISMRVNRIDSNHKQVVDDYKNTLAYHTRLIEQHKQVTARIAQLEATLAKDPYAPNAQAEYNRLVDQKASIEGKGAQLHEKELALTQQSKDLVAKRGVLSDEPAYDAQQQAAIGAYMKAKGYGVKDRAKAITELKAAKRL